MPSAQTRGRGRQRLQKFRSSTIAKAPVETTQYTATCKIIEATGYRSDSQLEVDAVDGAENGESTRVGEKTKRSFNWMTNVFGSGVPAEALDGVFSLMSWYLDLEEVEGRDHCQGRQGIRDKYQKADESPLTPMPAWPTWRLELLRGIEWPSP